MSYMFYKCENLNNLNLSSFNTNNVYSIKGIFHGCQKKLIDLCLYKFKQFNYEDLVANIEKKKSKKSI